MSTAVDRALRNHIVAHCVEQVRETPAELDPFPHFSIQGFLPADTYAELLERMPSYDGFEAFSYGKHQTEGESNRKRFRMTNDWLDRLDGRARGFWYSLRSALGSRELKHASFDKLAAGLTYRYGCKAEEVRDLPGFALPELFHETQGYTIEPHPDTRKKVVTMQIALPSDDSQKDFGTEFYTMSLNPLAWLREPRGFDIARRMPFLPNTVYAFSVLNTVLWRSWHGRTAISGHVCRTSLLNIWYEQAENANLDLVAEQEQEAWGAAPIKRAA